MLFNIEAEPAFILHTRPFRETSLLLEILTPHYGRMGVLARGVRQTHSKKAGLLQAFMPLLITAAGRSNLKTLKHVEPLGPPFLLTGQRLYSALYVNELLYKILPQHDQDEVIFHLYRDVLQALMTSGHEAVLRRFELRLLKQLGFGQNFEHDISHAPLHPDFFYEWIPDKGWQRVLTLEAAHHAYAGAHLLLIGAEMLDDPAVLKTAKRLTRFTIHSLISKPIASRMLFTA